MKPWLPFRPVHLTTYISLLGAEHLILDCKQTSVPPGALWEEQQTHLDQPEGRKQNRSIKYSCLALLKKKKTHNHHSIALSPSHLQDVNLSSQEAK